MDLLQQRLQEVAEFFQNNDTVLGYRRLMDSAMDTQDMGVYAEVIALTDWRENNLNNHDEFISKCIMVLEKIAAIPINVCDTSTPLIDASALTKAYGSSGFIVGPVTLAIKKGNVYGLVGENGNGKTTLLRILAQELDYSRGTINYGFNPPVSNSFELKTKLVYIPQRTATWYGSLKDNLKFVLANYGIDPEENETRVLMMIARLGLWNYKHLKWSELSSGYKMRFELARTLLRQPELLLLDEPLANLDVLAQQVILEDLKSICNSINNPIALILSSQQLYEIEKISDKVIYLKNGKYGENNSTTGLQEPLQLIVELDCDCDRSKLLEIFKDLPLEKLVFNGGVFLAYFKEGTPFYGVLELLGSHKIKVTYTRDISASTRRFFVS